jgi:Acetyltransferase (GNAT) domain
VTYWIGRSYWGKGIASDALNAFLVVDLSRPLHARVASDNVASRRVLEKCGFRVIATERNVAEARSAEIEELVLRLDELASTELEIRVWSRGNRAKAHGAGWCSAHNMAPSGAKFENDVFVERPDESASGDAHAA